MFFLVKIKIKIGNKASSFISLCKKGKIMLFLGDKADLCIYYYYK